jgi:hypothetical protein
MKQNIANQIQAIPNFFAELMAYLCVNKTTSLYISQTKAFNNHLNKVIDSGNVKHNLLIFFDILLLKVHLFRTLYMLALIPKSILI